MVILDKLAFKFLDALFDLLFPKEEKQLTTKNKETDAKKEILKEIKK